MATLPSQMASTGPLDTMVGPPSCWHTCTSQQGTAHTSAGTPAKHVTQHTELAPPAQQSTAHAQHNIHLGTTGMPAQHSTARNSTLPHTSTARPYEHALHRPLHSPPLHNSPRCTAAGMCAHSTHSTTTAPYNSHYQLARPAVIELLQASGRHPRNPQLPTPPDGGGAAHEQNET
jgi:hypothetical protein